MNPNLKIHGKNCVSAFFFFITLLYGLLPSVQAASLINKEHSIFFPKKLGATLDSYKNFPVTWWNFLIFDMEGMEGGWEEARRVCDHLKTMDRGLVSRIECRQDVKSYLPILRDWARDTPLRHDRPADVDLMSSFDRTLAKASLPLDKSLLSHLRYDPLESEKELRALITMNLQKNLELKGGFLLHPLSGRLLIPIQFAFPPDQNDLTSLFYETLNDHCTKEGTCDRWVLVGSHASTWENKNQIIKDVASVSRIGLTVLGLFCLGLLLIKRFKLLFIIPPILISVLLAGMVTIWAYGSIHGLVLAFGVGLVGISYDYGSHGALNPGVRSVWVANGFGYLTTIAVLAVLMFSQIPLLQQLMFFSIVGLTFAFSALLLLRIYFPKYSLASPLPLRPQIRKWKMTIIILVWLGLVFAWKIPLRLTMSGFDFQSPPQRIANSWFFQTIKTGISLFEIYSADEGRSPLEEMSRRLKWGQDQGIQVENAAVYLPPVAVQAAHLQTWKKACDSEFLQNLSPNQKKFFSPYLKTLSCAELKTNDLSHSPHPSYVAGFNFGNQWMTLWLPENQEEVLHISTQFHGSTSLKGLVHTFPQILVKELMWMGPCSFILVMILLFLYFKNWKLTLIALIPFVTGLGLIFWFHLITGEGFSFMSLIALVMIYGMSVDYGIFATSTYRHDGEGEVEGVWTALLMAALTTVAGFIPLDFCKHQVLLDLGRTLTVGMIGAVLGTFWGIPFALKRLKEISP